MGVAIIVPGVSFADANLGKVNISGDVPVQAISIVANDSYVGKEADLAVSYIPVITTQRGVTWSIVSGNEFATINAATGKIKILEGADNASVTVKAVSKASASISVTKTITVKYSGEQPDPSVIFDVRDKVIASGTEESTGFALLSERNTKWTIFVDRSSTPAKGSKNIIVCWTNTSSWRGICAQDYGYVGLHVNDPSTRLDYQNKFAIRRNGNELEITNDGVTWHKHQVLEASELELMMSNKLLPVEVTIDRLTIWSKSDIDVSNLF